MQNTKYSEFLLNNINKTSIIFEMFELKIGNIDIKVFEKL